QALGKRRESGEERVEAFAGVERADVEEVGPAPGTPRAMRSEGRSHAVRDGADAVARKTEQIDGLPGDGLGGRDDARGARRATAQCASEMARPRRLLRLGEAHGGQVVDGDDYRTAETGRRMVGLV